MYSSYILAVLTLLWPLTTGAPQQQDALQSSAVPQDSGTPDSWRNYLVYQQNGGTAKWIGPDPTHIAYNVILTTTNGESKTTTAPIDVSVQPASATATDGSYQEAVLLAPNVVAELADAAQQACGGKRRKRQTLTDCIRLDRTLQDSAANLIRVGMAPEKAEALGGAALAMIAANALYSWANMGSIPNAVSIDLGTPTQTLASSTTMPSATPSSTSTFSSSMSTPIGSTTTVVPGSKSQSTTSTASTSTVSPDSCWQYTGTDLSSIGFDLDTLVDTDANDPLDPKMRVRRATRVLEKRGRKTTTTDIGSCALSKPIRTIPKYWEMDEVMANMPPQQWWFVPSQEDRNYESCPIASIIRKGKRNDASPSSGKDNFPEPYNTQPGDINVEHVYELSLLKDFFGETFAPGDNRCENFTKTFLQPDKRWENPDDFEKGNPQQLKGGVSSPRTATPARFQDSRLQSLFNELPNKFNNAFLGLSKSVNGVKGCIFNTDCNHIQKVVHSTDDDDVNKNLNYWNDIGMVFQLMRMPIAQQQLQKVHQRIYEAFVSFEDIQACDPSSGLTTPWGEVYNNWFNNFLKNNQQIAADHVSSLSVAVAKPEVTIESGQKNAFGKAVDALSLSYGSSAIASGSLTFEIDKLLSIPARTTLGIARRDGGAVCSTTTSDPPVTGLPTLPPGSVCSTRQDKGNGVCPQIIIPNPSTTPCPPITTSGQYCADLITSTPSAPAATICPDASPNLAKNRCDQKCMGAGWGNCDANVKGRNNKYSCYCNAGPCGGQQCGDPVKIDDLTGKGTKCPDQTDPSLWFPDDQACDVVCPNGNYGAGDSCFAKTTIYHTMKTTPIIGPKYGTPTKTVAVAVSTASDKNGLVHWDAGSIPLCRCDDDPCRGFGCYDRSHGL